MKVLVIDDDPVALAILENFLFSLGHQAVAATNGASAWELLRQQSLRLVVCDWTMPGMNGLELCRRIRDSSDEYVYFILLTSVAASDQHQDEALVAGVDDFLSKPIDLQALKMRLHVAERILLDSVKIRQLEALIPICSYCKNVRDDKSYWQKIETYIRAKTGTAFSHSVCPSCYEKQIVPELKAMGVKTIPRAARPPTP